MEYTVTPKVIVFNFFEEFDHWISQRSLGSTFTTKGKIIFTNQESSEKFNEVWKIQSRYDNGWVKYQKY